MPILLALWIANYRVYGVRKLHTAAVRAGHDIGPDQSKTQGDSVFARAAQDSGGGDGSPGVFVAALV